MDLFIFTGSIKKKKMKKIILISAIAFTALHFTSAEAQVTLNINIGSQPTWGPTGYDHVDYYYIPDIESYYYVPRQQFIYRSNDRWIFSSALPVRYSNFNLNNSYKVVVNEPRAYLRYDKDRAKYANYRGNNQGQVIILNSDEPKYYVVKGHPKYKNNSWKGNGNGKEKYKGNKGNNGKGKGRRD